MSTTSHKVGSATIEKKYGSADLIGYRYSDWVCLGAKYKNTMATCMKDFNFLAIKENVNSALQP